MTSEQSTAAALSWAPTAVRDDADVAGYRHRAAALLRSEANDLKRNEPDAARDLGLPEEEYRGSTTDLVWEHAAQRRARPIQPGDSVYALPGVGLGLTARHGQPAVALLLRIGSAVDADVRYALGGFIEHQVDRYLCEDRQWYRTAGSFAAVQDEE